MRREADASTSRVGGRQHRYEVEVAWTGNRGAGTASYHAYARDHEARAQRRPAILASSDPAFRGDPQRWDPERLLLASLSQCHLLWYLHLCSEEGVIVVAYVDRAAGVMVEDDDGGGRFVEVTLRPQVAVSAPAMVGPAQRLHERAGALCFIARSVNFPVHHRPEVRVKDA